MEITLGNVAVALSVCGMVFLMARRLIQFLEFSIRILLLIARQQGVEVPAWLANQYKQINGNAKLSTQEKHDLLGPNHDSGNIPLPIERREYDGGKRRR